MRPKCEYVIQENARFSFKYGKIQKKKTVIECLFLLWTTASGILRDTNFLKGLMEEYHSSARSSCRRCSVKMVLLGVFAKFTGKHLCQSLFFNKVGGLRPATSLKTRPWHRCFLVNFAKILRTSFIIAHLWWLFLIYEVVSSSATMDLCSFLLYHFFTRIGLHNFFFRELLYCFKHLLNYSI